MAARRLNVVWPAGGVPARALLPDGRRINGVLVNRGVIVWIPDASIDEYEAGHRYRPDDLPAGTRLHVDAGRPYVGFAGLAGFTITTD